MTQKLFGAVLGLAFMLPAAISFSLWRSKKGEGKIGVFETPADAVITLGLAVLGVVAVVFYVRLLFV